VRLSLERILWERLPGACLEDDGNAAAGDSSSESDCEATRRNLNNELAERIRQCRSTRRSAA